jgi:hypothetical protein
LLVQARAAKADDMFAGEGPAGRRHVARDIDVKPTRLAEQRL